MNGCELIFPDKLPVISDGTGKVKIFFESDKLLFATFELEPGASLNKDIHPEGDEGYFVMQGTCTVHLPDSNETYSINSGEVFFIKLGVYHIASNRGSVKTVVLAAIAPHK